MVKYDTVKILEMNERKIIDRKLLAGFAKEVGLNALHLEALGENRQWEIVVGGDMLERLVEIQHQFEQLVVMGDDEYRGFYIEVPRPAPEEWGDASTGDSISKCHGLRRKSGGMPRN